MRLFGFFNDNIEDRSILFNKKKHNAKVMKRIKKAFTLKKLPGGNQITKTSKCQIGR